MRVLILTPSLPYPPIWGFGIRVFEFIRLLARRHQVSVVTYAAAIPFAFVVSWVSGILYALVAIMWLVPDPRIETTLAEREEVNSKE